MSDNTKNGNSDGSIDVIQMLSEKLTVLNISVLFIKNSIKKNMQIVIIKIFIYLFFILEYMYYIIVYMNKSKKN